MAVDVRSRYFAEPEEIFMPDQGAMMPSLSVFPQYGLPNNALLAAPSATAQAPAPIDYFPPAPPEVVPPPRVSPPMPLPPAAETPMYSMPTPQPVQPVPYYEQPAAFDPATFAAPVAQQYLPAVQPMAQEPAPVAFDPAMLQNLNLPDFSGGLGLVGGNYSGPSQAFTAPLSNKGNPTSQLGNNQFYMTPDTAVRLVNNVTGEVAYQGTGYDAANEAIKAAQALTAAGGNKAGWDIQTMGMGSPGFSTVANEKVNKSLLSKVANVVGTALPIAVGFIPGLQGVGAVLAAAGAGGAGAALRGDDILKGIAMGGLSAAGGQYLGGALKNAGLGLSTNAARAIGTGIGSTTGGVVTGQNLENALLGGVASGGLSYLGGEIMKPGAPKPTGAGPNANVNAPVDPSAITVTGTRIANLTSPSVNISSTNKAPVAKDAEVLDPDRIVVTGARTPALTSSTFSVGAPKVTPDFSVPEDILVTARKDADTTSSTVNVGGSDIPAGPKLDDQIVVTGTRTPDAKTGSSVFTVPGLTPLPKDVVDAAEKTDDAEKKDKFGVDEALALLGLVGGLGGGGGGGGGGTPGSQAINPIFSAKLPTPGAGGAFRVGGLDYTTPPARSAADMYRYAMGPAMDIPAGTDLSLATSPYAGYGPGTLGAETFRRVSGAYSPFAARRELMPNMVSSLGRDATSAQIESALTGAKTAEEARQINPGTVYFNIDAATANALGDPSLVGSVMPIQDLQRRMAARPMAHGGSMGYARGSSRESFAVDGPGTGRSDDIPAVLSDGEYVIDAETVALLGDGSSKAGAKKLDEMRVKIRKHKGRNLAKGKFSVNAKRPEKYLSGGRT